MGAYLLVVAVAILNILSVSLFKTGVAGAGGIAIADLAQPLVLLHKFLDSPLLIVGVAVAICTNLLWLVTLTRLPASVAVPLMNAVFYVALLATSALFLGEQLTARKLVAVGLILAGVVVLAR